MANPHPTPPPVAHRIKPGQVLNPSGKAKILPEEKAARKEMLHALWAITLSPLAEVQKLFPKPTGGQAAALKLFHRAVKDGSTQALQMLMDRIMGKVPQALVGTGGEPLVPDDPLRKLPPDALLRILAALEVKNA